MKQWLRLFAIAALFAPGVAWAQSRYSTPLDSVASVPLGVQGCLNASGQAIPASSSCANALPVTGTFSATLAGFTPNGSYGTPLSASTTSSETALPSGTTIAVHNAGSNEIWVNLGTSAAVPWT